MDPHLLTTFLAVRKHKNFTRAAEELSLSQPAVSRQIQQLERQLGMPVFDRLGKVLHVTDAGETLAAEGQKLLFDLKDVMEAVRRHASPDTGTLRLGAGTTPGLYLLPPVLGAFRRKHPNVEVRYSIERSANIVDQVLQNEIELGFVGCPVQDRSLVSVPIMEDRIVCFCGSRHPMARRGSLDIESLESETWIVRPSGSATRALFDSWLLSRKCSLGRTIEIGCPEGIRALVAAGVGLSYMSIHALAPELRRGQLIQVRLKGLPLKRSIWSLRRVDKRMSPPGLAFLELVRSPHARRARVGRTAPQRAARARPTS